MSENHLNAMARETVRRALARGAADAECTIREGSEFSVNVRMREVESLQQAGSRSAGLRVLIGKRAGSAYTSDLSAEGLERMVASALDLAAIAGEDPYAGLPDSEALGAISADLRLYCDDIESIETPQRIDLARAAEAAALDADPRITNSGGGSFESRAGRRIFANSRGFAGEYRRSYCSLASAPVARDGDSMERDYWFSNSRSFAGLESAAHVGRMAADRVIRRLGARKVETQRVPVVFEPRTARSIVSNIFEAVHGESVYRHASFLAGKLGEPVAAEALTLIDDGTIPGLFGTAPFDDEGVPSRRTTVIERGILKSYLLNTYTARKLGMQTTGNASRGVAGNAGIGHGNLFIEPGTRTPNEIIAGIANGLYVTELIGSGVNIVTGDYSRGAAGIWIRNGELAFPVSEITIAGNLNKMLMDMEAIGSDLEFRGSTASPTLLIREMTVGGR